MQWLFESKKRYGLCILNYMVTSNHIHLLVVDNGKRDAIPNSMQLMAGRTGQEYNQRKDRKGAFWEDRYHATAVSFDEHFFKCMVYIDMNMVRAGVVDHPKEWSFCGYNEIQNPRQRYSLIDYQTLTSFLQMKDLDELQESCKNRVEQALQSREKAREPKWSESIAVGNKSFIETTLKRLGIKALGRKVFGNGEGFEIREQAVPYGVNFTPENGTLRYENAYFWNDIL